MILVFFSILGWGWGFDFSRSHLAEAQDIWTSYKKCYQNSQTDQRSCLRSALARNQDFILIKHLEFLSLYDISELFECDKKEKEFIESLEPKGKAAVFCFQLEKSIKAEWNYVFFERHKSALKIKKIKAFQPRFNSFF